MTLERIWREREKMKQRSEREVHTQGCKLNRRPRPDGDTKNTSLKRREEGRKSSKKFPRK